MNNSFSKSINGAFNTSKSDWITHLIWYAFAIPRGSRCCQLRCGWAFTLNASIEPVLYLLATTECMTSLRLLKYCIYALTCVCIRYEWVSLSDLHDITNTLSLHSDYTQFYSEILHFKMIFQNFRLKETKNLVWSVIMKRKLKLLQSLLSPIRIKSMGELFSKIDCISRHLSAETHLYAIFVLFIFIFCNLRQEIIKIGIKSLQTIRKPCSHMESLFLIKFNSSFWLLQYFNSLIPNASIACDKAGPQTFGSPQIPTVPQQQPP